MEKLYEVALRKKYRFLWKGNLTVEDLWDLKVEDLDIIYKNLVGVLKVHTEESLLKSKSNTLSDLENQIEIVKHIVKVKLEEKEAASKKKENTQKRQQILEILAQKNEASLHEKSPEELMAMLQEIE